MSEVENRAHRLLYGVVGLGFLFSVAACQPNRAPPNILVINIDTLRADYLGVYGFDGPITPNINRFAQESVIFENCFSQAPWTKPSVASLFTSLYPQVHGVINYDGNYTGQVVPELQNRTGVLPERAVTLAEALQQGNYQTAGFISNIWLLHTYGFDQGFEFYYDEPASARMTSAGTLIDAAQIWLEARPSDRPFFVYMHFMDVHAPYAVTPKQKYDSLLEASSGVAARRLTDREAPFARFPNIEIQPNWTTEEMRHQLASWRTRYASGVQAFDRQLGSFLDFLREGGYLENTLVVLTSDHGEELFEHAGWSHGETLYDHQLHVPLIVRNPMGQGGGRRVKNTAQLIDVMPTLLSLSGNPVPPNLQGRDLSSLLRQDDEESSMASFATATSNAPGYHSVRTAEHKLILNIGTREAWLFDLKSDPGEQRNILMGEPEMATLLRARLEDHLATSLARGTLDHESAEVPDQLYEDLRTLGYLGNAPPDEVTIANEGVVSSIDTMLEVLGRSPSSNGYVNLSLAYYEQKDWKKCIESCERALELDPNNAVAYNNICSAYGMTQEWEKAVKACEK